MTEVSPDFIKLSDMDFSSPLVNVVVLRTTRWVTYLVPELRNRLLDSSLDPCTSLEIWRLVWMAWRSCISPFTSLTLSLSSPSRVPCTNSRRPLLGPLPPPPVRRESLIDDEDDFMKRYNDIFTDSSSSQSVLFFLRPDLAPSRFQVLRDTEFSRSATLRGVISWHSRCKIFTFVDLADSMLVFWYLRDAGYTRTHFQTPPHQEESDRKEFE